MESLHLKPDLTGDLSVKVKQLIWQGYIIKQKAHNFLNIGDKESQCIGVTYDRGYKGGLIGSDLTLDMGM